MKNKSLGMLIAVAFFLGITGSHPAEALTKEDLNVTWGDLSKLSELPIYKLPDEQRIGCTSKAFESHPEIPYELGLVPERVDVMYDCMSEALAKASARKERIKKGKKNKNKNKSKNRNKNAR